MKGCSRVLSTAYPRPGTTAFEHVDLAAELTSVRAARRYVADQLPTLQAEDRDLVVLLTSEVVTNAVLHARTTMCVGVAVADDAAVVMVHDRDGLLPEQRPYDVEALSGRGMTIVGTVADAWGVEPDGDGKVVWFALRPHANSSPTGDGGAP